MKDPMTKCNDSNDTQIIITEYIYASVLLELQSQRLRPESKDDLNTDFFPLNPWNILEKKEERK